MKTDSVSDRKRWLRTVAWSNIAAVVLTALYVTSHLVDYLYPECSFLPKLNGNSGLSYYWTFNFAVGSVFIYTPQLLLSFYACSWMRRFSYLVALAVQYVVFLFLSTWVILDGPQPH